MLCRSTSALADAGSAEQHDRAVLLREEVFQREDLAAVALRVLGQEADFTQAVEHDAGWVEGAHPFHHGARRFAQFEFRWMQHALLGLPVQPGLGDKLEDVDAVQGPAVAGGNGLQLVLGLRKRDIQRAISLADTLEEKAEGQRRLAGAGRPLDQVNPAWIDPAAEDGVKARSPG